MKNYIKSAALVAISSMFFAFSVFAQDTAKSKTTDTSCYVSTSDTSCVTSASEQVVNPQTDDLMVFFFSLAGLVLLVQVLSGWILKFAAGANSTIKQLITWVVSCGIAFYGMKNHIGVFADTSVAETIAYGIGVAMVSNHLYDAGTMDKILGLFFAKSKKA